jgi:hypothetical protein
VGITRARENRIQMRDFPCGGFERAVVCAKALCKFGENSGNLDEFFFGELDEPVIQINGFKRLDENRLASRARAMDHAGHVPTLRRAHGDYKPVVAQRHVIFAGGFSAGA